MAEQELLEIADIDAAVPSRRRKAQHRPPVGGGRYHVEAFGVRSQRVGDRVVESVNVQRQPPANRRREAARRRPALVERRVAADLDVAAQRKLVARVR